MKPLPIHAADLVRELNAALPPRPPRLADTDRQIWWDAGQRALIDSLMLRLAKVENSTTLLKER